MVKEFGNNADDFSEGGFGRYEGPCPLNAPDRDAGGDSSDDEEDPEENP